MVINYYCIHPNDFNYHVVFLFFAFSYGNVSDMLDVFKNDNLILTKKNR